MGTQTSRNFVVYTTALCAPCDGLKNYLSANGIRFKIRDLMMDGEAAEFIESKGIRSAPVLQIDDDLYYGSDLNKENLARILAL